MKHLSPILLTAAFLAAGTTACFKDPTSDLQNGPHRIELSRAAVYITAGDSTDVKAEVKDQAGNVFDASDAVWTSSNAAAATVRKDTTVIPGGAFARAFVVAVASGQAYIRVTSRGIADSLSAIVP